MAAKKTILRWEEWTDIKKALDGDITAKEVAKVFNRGYQLVRQVSKTKSYFEYWTKYQSKKVPLPGKHTAMLHLSKKESPGEVGMVDAKMIEERLDRMEEQLSAARSAINAIDYLLNKLYDRPIQ